MKKTLLSAIIIATSMGAFAQQNKVNHNAKPTTGIYITENIAAAIATSTTTAIFPPSFSSSSCSLTTGYALSSSTVGIGGYVAGNNKYGDQQKAMMYTLSGNGLALPGTVSQVSLYIGKIKAGGPGTGVISVKIYADNAGAPGTLLGTSGTKVISTLTASSYSNNILTFTTPVALTTDAFYVSVDFTGAGGDTLGLVSTISSTSTPCATTSSLSAWETDNTGAWSTFKADWNLTVDLGIFPVVSANVVTSTSIKNSALDASNVIVSPNPSNGLVNITVPSKNNEKLMVSVSNALGQVIISNTYSAISSESISLDFSSQNNGIYFISISNGQDKIVKRVVLNK